MYCKVCGNFLSETDTVCKVCGNDVELQRKQELAATEVAKSVGYAQREEKSEIDREKDEAINRIFYDGEGASARDRLEERRRKRTQERAPGLGGFFGGRSSQESAPKPADIPAVPVPAAEPPAFEFEVPATINITPEAPTPVMETPAPVIEAPAPAQPEPEVAVSTEPEEKPLPKEGFSLGRIDSVHVTEPAKPEPQKTRIPEDDRPRRDFRSEFVFGTRPAPQPSAPEPEAPVFAPTPTPVYEPAPAQAPAASEPLFTPAPAEAYTPAQTSAYTPTSAPAPAPEPTPVPDDFFALKVDEAEQELFNINKKNEEFQELLDEEFERLRRGGAVASEAQSLVREEVLTQAEPTPEILVTSDASLPIEDRIDDYLKRADTDMLREIEARIAERLKKEEAAKAAPIPEPEPTPAPAPIDPWAQAKREPAPVPGFAFDGKDYGHPFSHGAAPVSDTKTAAAAYIAQAEETTPEDEIILSQETLPEIPAKEEPQAVSYSILDEMFGNIPDTGEVDEVPAAEAMQAAPVCDPGVTATREPAPVPGFAFDGTDYGHALSHGAAPVSDLRTNAEAFIAQEEEGLSVDEAVLVHETDLEFTAPAEESASAPISYADFENFDFSATPMPEPAPEPTTVPEQELVAEPEPIPESAPVPMPEPLQAPVSAESSDLPAGWGRVAPTREQAQEFLSRPIAFPFDEPAKKLEPEPEPEPIVAPEPESIVAPEPEPIIVPEQAAAPTPIVAPEPESAVVPEPVIASAPVAEAAPTPIPHPQTGSEILSSRPQWRPEVSFVDLLAPPAEEAPPTEAPAETAATAEEAVPVTETLLAEVPARAEPAFTPLTPSAPVFEPLTPEVPAFAPPTPGPLTETTPLPTTPAAISYDDALAAPTITGAPGGAGATAEPRTAEPAKNLRETTKKSVSAEPSKLQRNVISVIITVLIVILVLVIACIATLKFMPDSVGAYYILDFIETIQAKLSGG